MALNLAKSTENAHRRNVVSRLMLRAYKALTDKDYKSVTDLADEAVKIDPELAGPYLLKGLALIDSGDKENALIALKQAQALDPEDTDIDTLLKAVQ